MVDVAIRVQVNLSNLTLRYPEFAMLTVIGEPHDVISEQPGQTFTVTNSFKFDRFRVGSESPELSFQGMYQQKHIRNRCVFSHHVNHSLSTATATPGQ
jgi:hypothetical protein